MEYLLNLGILFCIYGILALSLNMVVGMSGLLSLAQAAFYGVGAYALAICMTKLGLNFVVGIFVGILINMLLSYVVGKILSRFQGDYYAIVSAGFSIIVYSIFLNWKELTNGPMGIIGIKKPEFSSSNEGFLGLCVVFMAAIYAIYYWIDKSAFGRCLKAIREDEQLVRVMGYKAKYFKSIIFVLSAIISGIAGALFALYISFIDPTTFQLKESIFLFAIIVIGGLSSAFGSIAGAFILILLPEALRFLGLPYDTAAQLQQIIYGLILVLMVTFYPKGLFGKYRM